jgi:hypothetical protein
MKQLLAIIIICILILIVLYISNKNSEALIMPKTTTRIKLYEGYNFQNLAYDVSLNTGEYMKQILKVTLKSFDIDLPKLGDKYDEIRRVEIWSISNGDNNASIESGFYNSYLEPELEFRANPAKYKQIAQILPGQHLKLDVMIPVKKIFLIVNL